MKRTDFDLLAEKVSNWGRWGTEDQRGTLNHITPAILQQAAGAVRSGKLFNLGLNFDQLGPQSGPFRFNPQHYVTVLGQPLNEQHPSVCFSDDVIHMPLQAATQWDAFSHVHYDGMLYNNCQACDVLSVHGASRNSIDHLAKPGIMSRGVLLDIARLKGVASLPLDYVITVDDLNNACEVQSVTVEQGDLVMVRTGHMRRFTVDGDRATFGGFQQPGLSHDCADWIHDKSIAAIAADNLAVENISEQMMADEMPLPLHMLCLRDMGCPLGEMFNLEVLAEDCAADGQYVFLASAPPLAVTGAFGSPVNPLVLK